MEVTYVELMIQLLSGSWSNKLLQPVISEEDLNRSSAMLQDSGAGGLLWWQIRESDLRDSAAGEALHQLYRMQTLIAAKTELEIQNIFRILRSNHLEPILVKGWAIARHYPAKGLRPYGDIDLILHPKDRTKALEVMQSPEGRKYYGDFDHEELEKLDEQTLDDLFAHSQLVKLGETEIRVMGDEDHLRFLCIHLLRHGAWRPLWLCDIAIAVESRKADFDWQRCLGKDKNQADWVTCTIRLAHELLGADIRNTPAENKTLPKWFVPTVLQQWEHPRLGDHTPPELIMTSLRRPAHIVKAIRERWPNPISASIRMNAPFNECPRLPFQVANYAKDTASFAKRLAKMATGNGNP
jgi:hypothetical protein